MPSTTDYCIPSSARRAAVDTNRPNQRTSELTTRTDSRALRSEGVVSDTGSGRLGLPRDHGQELSGRERRGTDSQRGDGVGHRAVDPGGGLFDARCASGRTAVVNRPAAGGVRNRSHRPATWQLADSFDVLPNGLCAGRGDNGGIRLRRTHSPARQLHRLDDEATATARLTRPLSPSDDGLDRVLRAVFAPALPDPDGYSIALPGTRVHWDHLGRPGAPTWQARRPAGIRGVQPRVQTCPSLLDPPDKVCPEWTD